MKQRRHPYAFRRWWRGTAPWFMIRLGLAPKGKDCRLKHAEHHYYNIDGKTSGCYYCEVVEEGRKWKGAAAQLFLEERIFYGLTNLNDGFDVVVIRYFSETDFRILLDRAEQYRLQIFDIEPWFDGEYFDCAAYEEYSDDPADSSWYNEAFENFKARKEGLLYAASYGVSTLVNE